MLVSKAYASRAWTRHEFKSAFSRALQQSNEYILPLRIDDTDLPGLQPSIAYVDARELSVAELVELLLRKTGVASSDSRIRRTENLIALNKKGYPCVCFVIDKRYVLQDFGPKDGPSDLAELRLAVSFGENITHEFGPILAPPKLEGRYVLGMHCILISSGVLSVWDKWYDAKAYQEPLSESAAIVAAEQWLSRLSDEEYVFHAGEDASQIIEVGVSPRYLLEDFEIGDPI